MSLQTPSLSELHTAASGAQPELPAMGGASRRDPHREGGFDPQPGIARPSHAERARTLIRQSARATLSTIARDPLGYPFGSLVTYADDETGSPWMLISSMAEHTQNALVDMRASLMVAEATQPGVDPLALARVSLIGALVCDDPTPELCERFVDRNPGARTYLDFPDFSWWRLDVIALRYVGGFGRMSWVEAADYLGARPDPIASAADGICTHMNDDHAEAQLRLLQHFASRPDLSGAVMTGVDRLGCDFNTTSPSGTLPLRVAFPAPVESSDDVRQTLVAMLRGLNH
jgi:heme iron utilization protein